MTRASGTVADEREAHVCTQPHHVFIPLEARATAEPIPVRRMAFNSTAPMGPTRFAQRIGARWAGSRHQDNIR